MYESAKIAENIKNLSKVVGVQIKDILIKLKLNKNTLSSMYNGSMPKADSLASIADYLSCSVDYLLDRAEDYSVSQKLMPSAFTQEEIDLIVAYRQAEPNDRSIVDLALRKYAQAEQEKTVSAG